MKLNDVTGDLVIHREVYTDAVVYIWRFWAKARLFNVLYVLNNAALTEESLQENKKSFSKLKTKRNNDEEDLIDNSEF